MFVEVKTNKGFIDVDLVEKKNGELSIGQCKSCGAYFMRGKTKLQKMIPIVNDGGNYVAHFTNCPNAKQFRKSK